MDHYQQSTCDSDQLLDLFLGACGGIDCIALLESQRLIDKFIQRGITHDKYGATLLLAVARLASVETCEDLIDRGTDVNAADIFGRTPVLQAAYGENIEVVKLLLRHGADIHHRIGSNSVDAEAPMRLEGYGGIASLALSRQESASKAWTAIHIAARFGSLKMTRFLVEERVDPRLLDDKGHSARDIARDAPNLTRQLSFFECGFSLNYVDHILQSRNPSESIVTMEEVTPLTEGDYQLWTCQGYCRAIFKWWKASTLQDMACSNCHFLRHSVPIDEVPIPKALYVTRKGTKEIFLQVNGEMSVVQHPVRRVSGKLCLFLSSPAVNNFIFTSERVLRFQWASVL